MPKNKGRGGKTRRRGRNENTGEKRELFFKEEGQEYAQIIKMLGSGRFDCYCFDGQKRMATIRGKLRKKVWMGVGDIVLVSLRDFQTESKCDCIHKYNADEARRLKAYGEIPENIEVGTNENEQQSDLVVFGDDDEEGEDSVKSSKSSDDDKDYDSDEIDNI